MTWNPSLDKTYMWTAIVLADLNNPFGIFGTEPIVNIRAADSPTILPVDRKIPPRIPSIASGNTTLKIVWIFVAPSASDAWAWSGFTVRIASSVVLIIVGKTIIATVRHPARREYCMPRPLPLDDTKNKYPNKPNTIDGIEDRISVENLTDLIKNLFFA